MTWYSEVSQRVINGLQSPSKSYPPNGSRWAYKCLSLILKFNCPTFLPQMILAVLVANGPYTSFAYNSAISWLIVGLSLLESYWSLMVLWPFVTLNTWNLGEAVNIYKYLFCSNNSEPYSQTELLIYTEERADDSGQPWHGVWFNASGDENYQFYERTTCSRFIWNPALVIILICCTKLPIYVCFHTLEINIL